jgi:GTP-binding protein SAR1
MEFINSIINWFKQLLINFGLESKRGKLCILGLDNGGKTTLVNYIKTGKFQQFSQTKTYQRLELTIEGVTFMAYDLGGHEIAREAWKEYSIDAKGIIFVVDAAERARFAEARTELFKLREDPDIRKIPFAIVANKCDLNEVASPEEITHSLCLTSLPGFNAVVKTPECGPIKLFTMSLKRGVNTNLPFMWISNQMD